MEMASANIRSLPEDSYENSHQQLHLGIIAFLFFKVLKEWLVRRWPCKEKKLPEGESLD